MKHRYIVAGKLSGSDRISNFRLFANIRKFYLGEFVRVNIPDDLYLVKCTCDNYSTSYDKRTLDELGWDCYIFYKGKWRKFDYLKNFTPADWKDVLENVFSLYKCSDDIGWTDDKDAYDAYIKAGMDGTVPFKKECEKAYPPFIEDKAGLQLKAKLSDDIHKFSNTEWYQKYIEIEVRNFYAKT